MSNDDARLARVALTWLAEPGNRAVYRMVRSAGPVATLDRLRHGDIPDPGLRGGVLARLAGDDPRHVAERALQRAERLGARVVIPEDGQWPARLNDLVRLDAASTSGRYVDRDVMPPLCLWVRGPWPLNEALDRAVSVVGSRAASTYGAHVATDLAYGVAERDWTVVSGGAYGIDAAAHRGALTAGGLTVAVLACGVDRPYPMGNTALFDQIAENGLLISEWPPGAEPLRHRFLIRNRVIAAGTAGTVLVEAAARSGAMQTLNRAVALGRTAMVVPGPVTSAMSVGCHEKLRDDPRVRLVTGAAHVLEEVGRIGVDLAPPVRGPQRPHDQLDQESALVLEALPRRGALGAEELAARAGVDLRTVLRRLSLLETTGMLVRRDGGYALPPRTGPPTEGTAGPSAAAGSAQAPRR